MIDRWYTSSTTNNTDFFMAYWYIIMKSVFSRWYIKNTRLTLCYLSTLLQVARLKKRSENSLNESKSATDVASLSLRSEYIMNEPAVIGDFRWYRSWTVGFTPCLCIECPLRVADLDIDRRREGGWKMLFPGRDIHLSKGYITTKAS